MAVRFNLYYFSPPIGEYLQEVISTVPQGAISHASLLSNNSLLPASYENGADVYFVEYNNKIPDLDHWLESLQHQPDHPAVFLYLPEADTDILLKALRLGVQECFVSTIAAEDLQKALHRLMRVRNFSNHGEKAQIISLLGAKGGSGVTFIAVNLAHSLVAGRQESVLLADLDLRAANITSFLDIHHRYSILDVIQNFDRLDPQYLKDIVHHIESGPDVLPGPVRLEDSELVQAYQVEEIFQYIRSQNLYRWIILDLGDVLEELTLKALDLSDLVLLVTCLTIPGLRAAQKTLEMFKLLEFPEDKIKIVANSYCKDSDIKEAEAIKFLGQDFLASLRFDHNAVVRSINEGLPLVQSQPRHRLSLDFSGLVNKLYADGEGSNGHRPGKLASLKQLLRMR